MKTDEAIRRYRQDPVAFLTECLGITVDRWQEELIRSRMAKKKLGTSAARQAAARRNAKATTLKPRQKIDGIIRDRLADERMKSWSAPNEGYNSQGFCSGLEWVLLQLEALRS